MEELKVHILRRLYRHTYIGRRHMIIRDLQQGLPKEKRVTRDIKQAVKELLNEDYLILQHTDRVSINPGMLKKIKEAVE
ncbi:MAG: hypothetical protein KAU03_05360 [Candidatus Altiarchaeales archaeon]|nr:hypothetical protein [Candidatus Altiarchaeales archaeon]